MTWFDAQIFSIARPAVFEQWHNMMRIVYFFKDFIYLFLERGDGKEKGPSMCGCLSHTPYWGPGLQPRHVT